MWKTCPEEDVDITSTCDARLNCVEFSLVPAENIAPSIEAAL